MQLDVSRRMNIVYFYQVKFWLWQSPGKGCHVIEAGVRHDEFKVRRSCPFKSAWWNCRGLQVLHVFPPYGQKSFSSVIVLCNKQKAGPSFCWYFKVINNRTWQFLIASPSFILSLKYRWTVSTLTSAKWACNQNLMDCAQKPLHGSMWTQREQKYTNIYSSKSAST